MTKLASASGLTVAYGAETVLAEIDISVSEGERIAVIGESGSGKSTLALALAGLLSPEARCGGSLLWRGAPERPVGGRDYGFVFQDPSGSLDPVMTIGDQVAEVVSTHSTLSRRAAGDRARELLAKVGLGSDGRIAAAFPHQVSGGQKQRAAIAAAIAGRPRLLFADEPTSALDSIVQAEIVRLLDSLTREDGMALVLVTHDLALAAHLSDRMIVLRRGRCVDTGPTRALIARPEGGHLKQLVAAARAVALPARPIPGPS